jgi:hypothetical protein
LAGLTAAARDLQQRLVASPPWLQYPPPSVCSNPRVDVPQEGLLVVLVVVPEECEQSGGGKAAVDAVHHHHHQHQQQQDRAAGLIQESYRVVSEYLAPLAGQVAVVQQQPLSIQQQQQQQQRACLEAESATAAAAGTGAALPPSDGTCYVNVQGPVRLPPQLQTQQQQQQQQGFGLGVLPQRQGLHAVPHCVRKSEVLGASESGLVGVAMTLFSKVWPMQGGKGGGSNWIHNLAVGCISIRQGHLCGEPCPCATPPLPQNTRTHTHNKLLNGVSPSLWDCISNKRAAHTAPTPPHPPPLPLFAPLNSVCPDR